MLTLETGANSRTANQPNCGRRFNPSPQAGRRLPGRGSVTMHEGTGGSQFKPIPQAGSKSPAPQAGKRFSPCPQASSWRFAQLARRRHV